MSSNKVLLTHQRKIWLHEPHIEHLETVMQEIGMVCIGIGDSIVVHDPNVHFDLAASVSWLRDAGQAKALLSTWRKESYGPYSYHHARANVSCYYFITRTHSSFDVLMTLNPHVLEFWEMRSAGGLVDREEHEITFDL